MSDSRTHRRIGTLPGGGLALAKARQQRPENMLIEILCRLGAGALAGLLGGYGSHIALDAFTSAGLPLLA